jgi:hypothetical protein
MNYSDMIYKNSPEYQRAYLEGFNDGKYIAITNMLIVLEKIKKVEAFVESTGTTEFETGRKI